MPGVKIMPVQTRSGKISGCSSTASGDPSESKTRKKTSTSGASSSSKVQKPNRKMSDKYHPVKSSDSPETLAPPGLKKITPNAGKDLIVKLPRSTVKELRLKEPLEGDAKTLFALFLAADLSSARIGHDIAFNTTRALIKNGWDDVKKLKASSWQERTVVLTQGGYTRYRERTATFLGEVADVMLEKYDGDLNNLFEAAGGDISKTRELLKEFKGMGDTGVDIFLRDAQIFYDYLVPFADDKALKAAERAGIGKTAEELYDAVGKDPKKLSALCTSLVVQGF